jgi:hypothetical protein
MKFDNDKLNLLYLALYAGNPEKFKQEVDKKLVEKLEESIQNSPNKHLFFEKYSEEDSDLKDFAYNSSPPNRNDVIFPANTYNIQFSFAVASTKETHYPLKTSWIDIETSPSKTDFFQIQITIESESEILIGFHTKEPIIDRKFILYAKSKDILVELKKIENIEEADSTHYYDIALSDKNKIDWLKMNIDLEHRVFLQEIK